MEFEFDVELQLLRIRDDLLKGRYRLGAYHSFEISDPKRRLISAAPYRDRVVHHAICNIIEPLLETSFVHDSYACRKGKGQTRALRRTRFYCQQYPYVLKTDFQKYFPSIDHSILMSKLERKIGDNQLLELVAQIVACPFPGQVRPTYFPGDDLLSILDHECGLPIGNQTSQLFGNLFLNDIDHQIKEDWRITGYVRYMDDLLVFGPSKDFLRQALEKLRDACAKHRLRLHPNKTHIQPTRDGIRYLGFHVHSDAIRPLSTSVHRFRRRLHALQHQLDQGTIDLGTVRQSIFAYWGHFHLAGTPRRFRKMLSDFKMFEQLQKEEAQKRSS